MNGERRFVPSIFGALCDLGGEGACCDIGGENHSQIGPAHIPRFSHNDSKAVDRPCYGKATWQMQFRLRLEGGVCVVWDTDHPP